MTITCSDRVNVATFGKVGWWGGNTPKEITFHLLKPLESAAGGAAWQPHQDSEPWQLGVQWPEPRDVCCVHVALDGNAPTPKVQYWQHSWPFLAPERLPGARHAWTPVDDPYNGKWVDVNAEVQCEPGGITYRFDPLDVTELPAYNARRMGERVLVSSPFYEARFRRALKLRLLGQGKVPASVQLEAYSGSTWAERQVDVYFGCSQAQAPAWDGAVEAYNGRATVIEEVAWEECKGVRLQVGYCAGADGEPLGTDSLDRTIVTVRSKAASFSFLLADVAPGKPIYVPDLGVMVVVAGEQPDWQQLAREAEKQPSIYDRVGQEPEQTLQRTFTEIPILDVTKQGPFGRTLESGEHAPGVRPALQWQLVHRQGPAQGCRAGYGAAALAKHANSLQLRQWRSARLARTRRCCRAIPPGWLPAHLQHAVAGP